MAVDPMIQNLSQANRDLGTRVNKLEDQLTELKVQLRDYLGAEKASRNRLLGSLTTMQKLTSGIIASLEVVTQSFDSPAVSERRRIVEPAVIKLKQLKQLQESLEGVISDEK